MTFKEEMERDISETFLNEEEFAEPHIVAGKQIVCVFYPSNGDSAKFDAFSTSDVIYTLQASASDLPKSKSGDRIVIDGQIWIINDRRRDFGMSILTLSRKA